MEERVKRRLGEILVERGFVSPAQLQEALRVQYREGKRLGEILLEMGALSADELNWALSELLGIPYVEFSEEMVDLELARTLPEAVLRRHLAFPVLQAGGELTAILADPLDQAAILALEGLTGRRVQVAIASSEMIVRLLDKAFPPTAPRPGGVRYAEVGASRAPIDADATGVAQVYALLLGALREEATEVHLEPLPAEIRVRYRVDGRLIERAHLPKARLGAVVSRFRILAGLGGESLPCHAKVRTRLEEQEVELELLFFPTLHGEAVTVRLSQRGLEAPSLEVFDLDGASHDGLVRLLASPGIVFVTGRDAPARIALLYALAMAAAAPTKKTLTLEHATSYVVSHFVQVEAPTSFGETVATILAHPTDVALVEDLGSIPACLAALGAAEQGGLVLGGLASGTNATGLAHLLSLDLPRLPLLGATSGLVNVRRQGKTYCAGLLGMTDELRRELGRQGPWTSRIS